MKTTAKVLILLFLSVLFSCSKDEEIFEEPFIEEPKTGISFVMESKKADRISFNLKLGQTELGEFGQSLSNEDNYVPIKKGSYLIYNQRLLIGSNQIEFRAYVIEDNEEREVKATSIIHVEEGELTKVYLEII